MIVNEHRFKHSEMYFKLLFSVVNLQGKSLREISDNEVKKG